MFGTGKKNNWLCAAKSGLSQLARAGEIRLAMFVSVRLSNLCSYTDHQLIDDDGSEG
jgi:hypothetical protein